MGLLRLFFLALSGLLVARILRGISRSITQRTDHRDSLPPSEKMVQCVTCGLYLPESRAVQTDKRYFCSQAHCGGHHDGKD